MTDTMKLTKEQQTMRERMTPEQRARLDAMTSERVAHWDKMTEETSRAILHQMEAALVNEMESVYDLFVAVHGRPPDNGKDFVKWMKEDKALMEVAARRN